jgi:hypothetical protein
MSIWTSFVKVWTVCNCGLNANFLTFLDLNQLMLYLENIGVSWIIIWWLIFKEKPKSIKAGNLNSRLSYLITTVQNQQKKYKLQMKIIFHSSDLAPFSCKNCLVSPLITLKEVYIVIASTEYRRPMKLFFIEI